MKTYGLSLVNEISAPPLPLKRSRFLVLVFLGFRDIILKKWEKNVSIRLQKMKKMRNVLKRIFEFMSFFCAILSFWEIIVFILF